MSLERNGTAMSQKSFSLVAGLIFLVMAVLHVVRLVMDWNVVFAGWSVPMWVSWIALPICRIPDVRGPETLNAPEPVFSSSSPLMDIAYRV